MASEPIALIDLDGTLADFNGAMKSQMAELATPFELTQYPNLENEDLPWIKARRRLIKKQPGFWEGLTPIPEGFAVLQKLREFKFTLNILTKGPFSNPTAWGEKVAWSQKHVPDAQVTVTQDKGNSYGRVLFDDWPEYILRWLEWRPRGLVIMLDHPYNQEFQHPNVFRYRRNIQSEEWRKQEKALDRALNTARRR